MPSFHLSGMQGVCIFLFVVATFGAAHLLAASHPTSTASQAWTSLGF